MYVIAKHSTLRDLQIIPYIQMHSALRELLAIPYIQMHNALRELQKILTLKRTVPSGDCK